MDTYTHGHADPVLQSHRWRTVENSAGYLAPALRPGMDVLDVGCGPGTITVDLAARVAPGRVVGLGVHHLDEQDALGDGVREDERGIARLLEDDDERQHQTDDEGRQRQHPGGAEAAARSFCLRVAKRP